MGVPVVIGGKGVEKIIELPLTERREGDARQEREERAGGRRHLQEGLTPGPSAYGFETQRLDGLGDHGRVRHPSGLGAKRADDAGVRDGEADLASRAHVGVPGADAFEQLVEALTPRRRLGLPAGHPGREGWVALELRVGTPLPGAEGELGEARIDVSVSPSLVASRSAGARARCQGEHHTRASGASSAPTWLARTAQAASASRTVGTSLWP